MTDKQIIRAEIDRLQSYSKTMGDNAINSSMQQFYDGMKESCIEILSFIDSMPEEPASKDLEKASKDYQKKQYGYTVENNIMDTDCSSQQNIIDIDESFKAGAQWQKQQMMKEAVEADAIPYDNEFFCDFSQLPDIGDWERVKLIVVKED